MDDLERRDPGPVTLSAREVLSAVATMGPLPRDAIFAFDGDGTLWSGDVGEDVFHVAVQRGLLRDAAREALVREAAAFDVDTSGTSSELAARLFEAYLAGSYPEREVCGMMSYCYAGFKVGELQALTDSVLEARGIAGRLNRELEPILAYARNTGLRAVVVSASPQTIVERAARHWQIAPEDVAACRPALSGEHILPALAGPVPYAEAKLTALSAVGAHRRQLLASFGDNVFDIELLSAARLGVVVRPKPALAARLPELPGLVVLERENG